MGDLTITEFSSVSAIEAGDWQLLSPHDDPMWSRAYFLAMEKSELGVDVLRYLTAHHDGQLVAATPVFWFRRLALDRTSGEPWRKGAQLVRRVVPTFMRVPALFCGHPMGRGRILAKPEWEDAAWRTLGHGLRDIADREGLRYITMKDFVTADRAEVAGELKHFFVSESLPDAVLRLEVSSFDDYLARLRPKARRNARSKKRKFAANDAVRIEAHSEFAQLVPQMVPLYEQVYRRAEIALDHLDAGFFQELASSVEIDSELIACWRGTEMIGFVLCLYSGTGAVVLRSGLDYSCAREFNVWFALHYAAIDAAIERGVQTLNFCQTTYPAKREVGCELLGLSNAVSHVNPLMRTALRAAAPFLHRSYRRRSALPPIGRRDREGD
jgi:predicted N-acyltransferase